MEGYVARVIVDVMLKPEIHDPQGEAVLSASHRLGFGNVTGVRQGKRFELELDRPADDAALAAVEEIARELLANPVIERVLLAYHGVTCQVPDQKIDYYGVSREIPVV